MPYLITDDCISCGCCEGVCPVNAVISNFSRYVINTRECIDCGTCEGICPVDAIVEEKSN